MEDDVGDQNPGNHSLHFGLFQLNGKEHCHDCWKYELDQDKFWLYQGLFTYDMGRVANEPVGPIEDPTAS